MPPLHYDLVPGYILALGNNIKPRVFLVELDGAINVSISNSYVP